MKKILLVATALAFAGSAFAATVSGSVTTRYYTADQSEKNGVEKGKRFGTSGEVVFSDSKTTSSGLTFGGTYKVKVGNATSENTHLNFEDTRGLSIDNEEEDRDVLSDNGSKVGTVKDNYVGTDSALTGDVAATIGDYEPTKSEASAFVSGSWGRVDLGHHDSFANKAVGGDVGTESMNSAITYTSPSFSGFSGGYTYGGGEKDPRGFGIKYEGAFSGADIGFGYGSEDVTTGGEKVKESGWKLSGGMSGITFEYASRKVGSNSGTGMSLKYAASNWDVKYGTETKPNADKTKKTTITANYTVAEGLKVTVEDKKDGEKKTTYIGTKISF